MKPGHFLVPAALLALILGIGCSKNNSKTKPKITLESINTTVKVGDSLRAMFKLSNGAGASGGTFVAIRNRLNQTALPAGDSIGVDTFGNALPTFSSSNYEIRFTLFHDFLNPSSQIGQNDTLIYKFFVLTTGAVSSDTISSPQIVVLYQ